MIIKTDTKYNGYYKVDNITYQTSNGSLIDRELIVKKDGVGALVYDTRIEKYILTSQWRPCSNDKVVEIVGGSIDGVDIGLVESIEKEILEEIGYKIDRIKSIDSCYVSPGSMTEMVYIYYVEVSEMITSGGGSIEEGEEIDIIYMTKEQLLSSKFYDAKTIIAVNWLRIKDLEKVLELNTISNII